MSSSLYNLEYIQFIEPHLSLQIYEFLLKQNPSNATITSAYKELLANSRNYSKQKEHCIKTDEGIASAKVSLKAQMEEMETKLHGFLNLIENCRKIDNYDLNSFSLGKKIIDETSPLTVLEYSKCLFDLEQYTKTKDILYGFAKLNKTIKKNQSKAIIALYLIYSINILTNSSSEEIELSFIDIVQGIDKLKNYLDEEFKKINLESAEKITVDFKHILLYRGYVVHWALFLLKNNLDLFLSIAYEEHFYSLIQSTFPYMLKYLIVFTVLSKSKKYIQKLKELFSSSETQGDIFVDLFTSIYISYDYEMAMKKLKECTSVLKGDFFIHEHEAEFIAKCKEIIIENYIITNSYIEIKQLSEVFEGDCSKTKESIESIIRTNFPLADIREGKDYIEYSYSDKSMQEYVTIYEMKSEELLSLTRNMIDYIKKSKE